MSDMLEEAKKCVKAVHNTDHWERRLALCAAALTAVAVDAWEFVKRDHEDHTRGARR